MVEEDTGDIIDTAVFQRNLKVEDRLNVKLNYIETPARGADPGFKNKVSASVMTGDFAYDLGAAYGMCISSCAVASLLFNLREVDHVDLDMPWYYDSAIYAGTFGNAVYYTAGDISYSALARMSGVFFNWAFINDYRLDNPYDIVLNGNWTMDVMLEMIKDVYVDVNNNGKKDQDDIFGMLCAHDQIQCTYYAGGFRFVDLDEKNIPKISDDTGHERVFMLIDKWIEVFKSTGFKGDIDVPTIFVTGRSLFYVYPLGFVTEGALRNSEVKYGFIPQPKVDDAQKEYYASVTNAVTLWAVPLVVYDHARSGALLECLASEGHRTVTPSVFEVAYKVKYNNDESNQQAHIFDILRKNVRFDLGKIFSNSMGGLPNSMYADNIWNGNNTYASKLASNKRVLDRYMQKILSELVIE
ncbi:MAG: hypothetical protein GX860_10360 [Alcaligenaceae bacterium]|nr:hypothetical protein [Alcaligenaceae bacterium]